MTIDVKYNLEEALTLCLSGSGKKDPEEYNYRIAAQIINAMEGLGIPVIAEILTEVGGNNIYDWDFINQQVPKTTSIPIVPEVDEDDCF